MSYISFQPKDNFKTKLYTGNASAGHSITGIGFQPDIVWAKSRDEAEASQLYDSPRGVTKRLFPHDTEQEETVAQGLTAFGADGFTLGSANGANKNSQNFVAWNWKGGTTSGITTNGSTTITPSTYSFNATAGIAILKFTGNSTAGAKLAHGLGGCDTFFVKKTASAGDDWRVYHKDIGGTHNLKLNSDDGDASGSNIFNDTVPDATNITLGSHTSANGNADNMICYAFRGIKGFSKFGTYNGNGSTNGPMIFCGFKPAFVMTKCSSHGSSNWVILDATRDPYNVGRKRLYPNLNNAEDAADRIDFLSNGFKIRGDGNDTNGNTRKYLYWAFAKEPLVASNGTPATAR